MLLVTALPPVDMLPLGVGVEQLTAALLLLPQLLLRFSVPDISRANRGSGRCMGRSADLPVRFLRGSTGASSKFSSQRGVPGRLPSS